jgi:hypothetical protein
MLDPAGEDASKMTLRYFNPSLVQRLLLAMLVATLLHAGSLYEWAVFSLSGVPEPESFESFDDWAATMLSSMDVYFSNWLYEIYIPVTLLPLLLLTPLTVADRRWLRFGGLLVINAILMLMLFEIDNRLFVSLDTEWYWILLPVTATIYALCAGAAVSLVGGLKTNRLFWPAVIGAGVLGSLVWEYGDSVCQTGLFGFPRCSPWPSLFGVMTYLCFLSTAFYVGSDAERNEDGNYVSRVTQ